MISPLALLNLLAVSGWVWFAVSIARLIGA